MNDKINGLEYVDLGLPSGTLWATCNIGAEKFSDFGDYLTWEEGDNAVFLLRGGWSLPTKEQWEELKNHTKSYWSERNGNIGKIYFADNGTFLFCPAAGYFRENGSSNAINSCGHYWLSSINPDYPNWAYCFYFDHDRDTNGVGEADRLAGLRFSVRAVFNKR